jgi:hypothetical protein
MAAVLTFRTIIVPTGEESGFQDGQENESAPGVRGSLPAGEAGKL